MTNRFRGLLRDRRMLAQVLVIAFLSLFTGLVLGYAFGASRVVLGSSWGPIREPAGRYKMIRPLLGCDFPVGEGDERLSSLEKVLRSDVVSAKKEGMVKEASVYVRAIDSGRSVGVDEDLRYDPASMIKVLLMMSYARAAEADPRLLEKRLTYTEDIAASGGSASYYGTTSLSVGSSYRIGDLIDTMIVDSDNGAKDLLLSQLPIEDFSRTLGDFGLSLPKQGAESLKMSPKGMSIFFRTLYSATYLNPTNSEVALDLLARTKWKEGIVEGVPYGTVVAHKFGEFVILDGEGRIAELELHDCGIVYAPNEPYFVCVMTKGTSHERLAKLIATVSQHAYAGITDARP